jgi:hypothetical protein
MDSSDDEEYHATCARIQQTLAGLEGKRDRHGNRFDALRDGSSEDEDEGGWKTVEKPKGKRKSAEEETRIKVVRRIISKEECKYRSELFEAYLQALTGKEVPVVITSDSAPFVSQFEACMARDRLLAPLFDRRPTIVDPMCGSGLDACAFLFDLFPEAIYINDSKVTYEAKVMKRSYGVMELNVNNMRGAFDVLINDSRHVKAPYVDFASLPCADYIRTLSRGMLVHILYLDPPWALPGADYEMTAEELAGYLDDNVFRPLAEMEIVPRCIVFKTRWDAGFTHHVMEKLNAGKKRVEYHAEYSVQATPYRPEPPKEHDTDDTKKEPWKEVKGTFHWAVIVHSELKEVAWHRTQAYNRLFKEHKDVIVLKKNLIDPNIPLYASQLKEPVVVDYEEEGKTLRVKAPRMKRPRN